MKRVKKEKSNRIKYELSKKQIDKLTSEITRKTVRSAMALILAATYDTLGLTNEQAREIKKTADRYSQYILDGVIPEGLPSKVLKKEGVELKFIMAEEDNK